MAFGIDLGTTNSCVARIDDTGRAVIVKSALGEDKTPSAVYFESPRHAVVGRTARNAALVAPEHVAQQVKRDMGKDTKYTFHGQEHTPEMVSALILKELARGAEENSGQVVRDVVITVPATFGSVVWLRGFKFHLVAMLMSPGDRKGRPRPLLALR